MHARLLLLALLPLALGCFPKSPGTTLAHFADQAPAEGAAAPLFELQDLEGAPVQLAELIGDKPVVVQLGSHSCPVYRYRRHTMDNLWEEYEGRVHFLVVYTREAHPVGSESPYRDGEWDPMINRLTGARVAEPQTLEERRETASYSRQELELPVPVLVDDMENSVWSAYGAAASPGFVIDTEGRIALRQVWLNPKEIKRTLDGLLLEER
ncbi:MAG: deiodinase-like protein [Acidobacteriota bacterium]